MLKIHGNSHLHFQWRLSVRQGLAIAEPALPDITDNSKSTN